MDEGKEWKETRVGEERYYGGKKGVMLCAR